MFCLGVWKLPIFSVSTLIFFKLGNEIGSERVSIVDVEKKLIYYGYDSDRDHEMPGHSEE